MIMLKVQDQTLLQLLDTGQITIVILVFSIIFGLLIHLKLLWPLRVVSASIMSVLVGISAGLCLVSLFNPVVIALICLTLIYRLFSYLRVIKNRINPEALRTRSLRSELFFSGFLTVLLLAEMTFAHDLGSYQVLLVLSAAQFVYATLFFLHIKESSSSTFADLPSKHLPDIKLPSITVAIPARNETSELTSCLQSILSTNYPKMEILVLDDCSQDATADIIRGFAHDGVRFVEGKIPGNSWLAKNFAYQQLLDESEGKYIIYCGVDVRFDQSSIRSLVEIAVKNDKKMISILPTRNGLRDFYQIIQPMRYWRELAIPRLFNKTPPSLSTCWLVDRDFLEDIGGFSAYKKSVRPEKYFAKRAFKANSYSFLRSSFGLGISSVKNYSAQWDTSVRTRYPEHKKRPENIYLFSIWFLLIFVAPFFTAVFSLGLGYVTPFILSAVATILLLVTHFKVDKLTNGQVSISKMILFPLSVVMEIIVINYSMWAYEFSEVIWKGRNICLPVLKVVPKLSILDK